MANCFCCNSQADLLGDSLLDVGPKVRRSFIQQRHGDTLSLKLGRRQKRQPALSHSHRQTDLNDQTTLITHDTAADFSRLQKIEQGGTAQKEQLILSLQQRNRQLRELVRNSLLPLEQQYLVLFAENRRKGSLLDQLTKRLFVCEQWREKLSPTRDVR